MSDEALRALARAVDEVGTPEARLHLARALERAGRRDEALDALLPAAADLAVREELRRWPAWTHEASDAGRTRHLDVRPLASAPRLRWHLPDPQAGPFARRDGLLGGPLGLVTGREALKITVLEPDTGAVRATTPVNGTGAPPTSLAGEVLLVHCEAQVRAIHLRTDVDLHQLDLDLPRGATRGWRLDDPTRPLARGGDFDLALPDDLRHDHNVGRSVQGHGLLLASGPIRAGEPRSSFFIGDTLSLVPHPDVVVAQLSTNNMNAARHVAYDRATRAERWRGEGTVAAADGEGVLLSWCSHRLTLRGLDGAVRWSRDHEGGNGVSVLGLAPRAVLAGRGGRLLVLDRDTGADAADLGAWAWDTCAVALVRDTVYVGRDGELSALGLDGAARWTVPLGELARGLGLPDPAAARVHALAPGQGRLYAKTRDGTVYAFEG